MNTKINYIKVIYIGLILTLFSFNQPNKNELSNAQTPCDLRKEAARILIEEVLNKKNLSRLDQIMADAVFFYGQDWTGMGTRDGLKKEYEKWFVAFPDFNVTTYQILCEGDYVAVNCSFTGTHKNTFMGIDPLNNRVNMLDAVFLKFDSNNKITEYTEIWDNGRMKEIMAKKP